MTKDEIETLLDSGQLQVHAANDRWYDVRRNGKTQTWKRAPSRFRIPAKFAFRSTFQITESRGYDVHSYLRAKP